MKFDLVTLYPMHRRCITLISSLLTLSGWVRKPLDFLKVRIGMYWDIPVCTDWEFLYWPVPSCTGTYWYVPVRTILPNPVQGYRIPDEIRNFQTCHKHVQTWYVHSELYTCLYHVQTCMYCFALSCPGVRIPDVPWQIRSISRHKARSGGFGTFSLECGADIQPGTSWALAALDRPSNGRITDLSAKVKWTDSDTRCHVGSSLTQQISGAHPG